MKGKKFLALAMSAMMLVGVVPVYATDAVVDYTNGTLTQDTYSSTEDCEVYAYVSGNGDIVGSESDIKDAFTVIIPKKITLGSVDGAKFQAAATYNVTVYGDVIKDHYIYVAPNNFTLGQTDRNDVNVTVSQKVQNFYSASYSKTLNDTATKMMDSAPTDSSVSTTGTVTTSTLSAGSWSGILEFNIDDITN